MRDVHDFPQIVWMLKLTMNIGWKSWRFLLRKWDSFVRSLCGTWESSIFARSLKAFQCGWGIGYHFNRPFFDRSHSYSVLKNHSNRSQERSEIHVRLRLYLFIVFSCWKLVLWFQEGQSRLELILYRISQISVKYFLSLLNNNGSASSTENK